jgi:hypothetical protein
MEQQTLYNRFRDAVVPATASGVANKFLAGPINPAVQISTSSPVAAKDMAINQQLDTFKCPSFPGADESKVNFINGPPATKAAVGNYVAVVSTHLWQDGTGNAKDTGGIANLPNDSMAAGSKPKQLAGNGALPFWNRTVAQNTPGSDYTKVKGATHAALSRDGTSNTIMFAESREEDYTGWVSGLASYVVAADPDGPGADLQKLNSTGGTTPNPGQPLTLQWPSASKGQTALNIGSNVKRAGGNTTSGAVDAKAGPEDLTTKKAFFYQTPWAHGTLGTTRGRVFGPSSAHSGDIVLHGYGDAHGKAVSVSVDRNVYLWQVTRAGSEIVTLE